VRALAAAGLLAASAASAGPPPIAESFGFRTPSGNIVCASGRLVGGRSGAGLLCVVFSASEARGQKTWYVRRTGRAGVRFVQSNIRTERLATIAYGRSWSRLGFVCTSRRAGLTCRNRSGHGFFLSRESQRRF
jgi:hypothetical protein